MGVRRAHKPHWYRWYRGECPACGRDASYKERVYGRKPKRVEKRIIRLPQTETYCGCIW